MDLIVDATLDDTDAHLKAIHQEFAGAGKQTKEDAQIWGQSDVQRAMRDFTDDWWVHRKKVDDRLQKLSDNVTQCCTAWSDSDKQLADNLTSESTDA